MSHLIKDAAEAIARARVVIGFTGAGVSVESGIPDFRNAENFWEGFNLESFETEIDNREAFENQPDKVWRFFHKAISVMEKAKPNDCHNAMARLGTIGKMTAVITQNVDGLHQEAGSANVIEIHGNIRQLHCPDCEACYDWHEVRNADIPLCPSCESMLRPDVPLFGEEIKIEPFSASRLLAVNTQVMVIVGAYGAVAPINKIPLIAKENGALIIEINMDKSLYTDRITDIFLQGRASIVLLELVCQVENFMTRDLEH
jgi:NAD-dependent deacetylase